MIRGSMVALVTPMLPDGVIDWARLDALVDWHLESGTNALVAVGTSGESPTLNVEEHLGVVEAVIRRAAGRVPVIAGTGANSTAEAIELTQAAEQLGADATLQVVPYYNKPTQEGLYLHFRTIAEATGLPVILYNVPGRTVADLLPPTVARLAQVDNIVGIKDATGDMTRVDAAIQSCGSDFAVYSGDDFTALELMLRGGQGSISVTANVAPVEVAELCQLALAGQAEAARQIDDRLQPLNRLLFIESNPIPVKWALYLMGRIDTGIRLPLTPLSVEQRPQLEQLLDQMQMLSR